MGVEVGLATQVLDEVDHHVDAASGRDLEILGPDAERDFVDPRVVELGQLVAFEWQRGVLADAHAVGRRSAAVSRFIAGDPMKPATNALAGLS